MENSLEIRWLIRRDMPEVLEIERSCFKYVWTEKDFRCWLSQRTCIGMVAEHDRKIVGFMVYELDKTKLRILNFAVAPTKQRRGIGTAMIRELVEKITQQRRKEIVLAVRESNLPAQMFLKEQGFRAVRVLRNHYDDSTEDAYVMQYLLEAEDRSLPFSPDNRISGILEEQEYE